MIEIDDQSCWNNSLQDSLWLGLQHTPFPGSCRRHGGALRATPKTDSTKRWKSRSSPVSFTKIQTSGKAFGTAFSSSITKIQCLDTIDVPIMNWFSVTFNVPFCFSSLKRSSWLTFSKVHKKCANDLENWKEILISLNQISIIQAGNLYWLSLWYSR